MSTFELLSLTSEEVGVTYHKWWKLEAMVRTRLEAYVLRFITINVLSSMTEVMS